jgi:hypothetical protein
MLHLPAAKIHTARRDTADILVTAPAVTAQPDSHQKCANRDT